MTSQPTLPPTTSMKIKSIHSIHSIPCPVRMCFFSGKIPGLQSVPMASQKLLILTGLGNPMMGYGSDPPRMPSWPNEGLVWVSI